MATLNTRIALFAGHDIPRNGASAERLCTVAEFHADNADAIDGDALQAMLDDLDAHGRHLIGGGAAPAFILLRIDPIAASADAQAWPFRQHRSQAEAHPVGGSA